MRKILNVSVLSLLTVFSMLAMVGVANAQPGWARGRNTRGSVDQIIRRVENRVDRFVNQFDRALDNSRVDGTQREDNLNQRARELERATNELRNEFNRRGNNWWETRENVQRSLRIASDINQAMRNRRLNRATENNWRNVRNELNTLARVYNLSGIGAYR